MTAKITKTAEIVNTAPRDKAKWNPSREGVKIGRTVYPVRYWNDRAVRNSKQDGTGEWVALTAAQRSEFYGVLDGTAERAALVKAAVAANVGTKREVEAMSTEDLRGFVSVPTPRAPRKATAKAAPGRVEDSKPVAERTAVKKTEPKATDSATAEPKPVGRPKSAKVAVELPAGYFVRWPHGGYDLATSKAADADPKWFVICNVHGTTTTASAAKEGDLLGSKSGRLGWCAGCKRDAKTASK